MTVSTETVEARSTGNGATRNYDVPFQCADAADVKVSVLDVASGVETLLVLDVDYTVNGDLRAGTASIETAIAYPEGKTIIRWRETTALQKLDYIANDGFPAEMHERGLDILTFLAQELREGVTDLFARAIVARQGEAPNLLLPFAADRAGKVIGFDGSGNILVSMSYQDLLNAETYVRETLVEIRELAQNVQAIAAQRLPIVNVAGDYTMTYADLGKRIRVTSAIDTNIYVPDDLAQPTTVGFNAEVQQAGIGKVYIIPFSTAIVNSMNGYNGIEAQFGVARVVVDSATTVNLDGDLLGSGGIGWIQSAEIGNGYIDIVISTARAGGSLDPSKLSVTVTEPATNLATGAATTTVRTLGCTKWARLPVPDYLTNWEVSIDGATQYVRVWLESFVYSSATSAVLNALQGWWIWDSIGAPPSANVPLANSATRASPAPFGNWVMPSRQVVGNSLTVEFVAFHRNAQQGRMIAGGLVTVTDSVGATLTQWVNSTVVSGRSTDRCPVIVYRHTFDISSLATGSIKVDCVARPFIGSATYNTATAGSGRIWNSRYFLKDVTLAGSPYYVYVNEASGNDTTGAVSTTAATAAAAPCATIAGALKRLNAVAGRIDGGIVRVMSGGASLGDTGATFNLTQNVGCVTITRDPSVSRAAAPIRMAGATFRPRITLGLATGVTSGCVRFNDCQVVRTGAAQFAGETGINLSVLWDDVEMDNASITTAWLSSSARDSVYGMVITNAVGNVLASTQTGLHNIWRGLVVSGVPVEQCYLLGSELTSCTNPASAITTTSVDGGFVYCNKFLNASNLTLVVAQDRNVTGFAIVQNLFEHQNSANTAAMWSITRDNATGNVTHMVIAHNTLTGAGLAAGRGNLVYDDGATHRVSTLLMFKGNIHSEISTKADRFVFLNEPQYPDASARTGNWEYANGVDCEAEVTQFLDGSTTGFQAAREHPGINALVGTSDRVRLDVRFVDYRGTQIDPVSGVLSSGTGGGDYRLQNDSPARSRLRSAVLSHTLDGVARPTTNDNSGAFSVAA
ncbi:hypothetical protein FHS96_004992 [Sphingomonas zeicaulis]|uniref:hypothetical protein n=1 Tax=Sphingomonas zeicaulis TaxID=1632740 RepID=UPI003D1FF671